MPNLNSAQLNNLKRIAESGLNKQQVYLWINENFSDEDKRKHAKQAVRRWLRNADPNHTRTRNVDEDGPTAVCHICNTIVHNTETQFVQLAHYDSFHHVCNDCAKDRRERGEYIMSDFEFKQSTVSAGNPKKTGEHGKVNHVGAFSNTLRAYDPKDYPTRTKDTADFDNYYDGNQQRD